MCWNPVPFTTDAIVDERAFPIGISHIEVGSSSAPWLTHYQVSEECRQLFFLFDHGENLIIGFELFSTDISLRALQSGLMSRHSLDIFSRDEF